MKAKWSDKVRVAWWLWPYFYILAGVSAITGRDPDWKKVQRVIDRAIKANW